MFMCAVLLSGDILKSDSSISLSFILWQVEAKLVCFGGKL